MHTVRNNPQLRPSATLLSAKHSVYMEPRTHNVTQLRGTCVSCGATECLPRELRAGGQPIYTAAVLQCSYEFSQTSAMARKETHRSGQEQSWQQVGEGKLASSPQKSS
ncbi:unnamed protein product [Effrenium voratum]|nr:unnamed protein product [Effrenium voratum]